jgi:colicin import membrane protein
MKSYSVNRRESYRFTLLLATLFHALLFSTLFLTLRYSVKPLHLTASAPPMTIIHATAIANNPLPESNASEEAKTRLPAEKEKTVIPPALIEKSPLALVIKEKKSPKVAMHTPPVAVKLPIKNAAVKKLHSDKVVQHKILLKKMNLPLEAKSLKIAQKNVQQWLQQEVNVAVQKQQTATDNTATTDKYRHLILQSIARQWIIPPELNKHLETRLAVHLAPGGMVLEVIVVKSSGNAVLDRSAQTAVYKASPLPVPKNIALFNTFRKINLTVRPEGMITQ